MKVPRNPAKEAAESRDLARRARRLAQMVSDPKDQDRINSYAAELEQRARQLEAEAAIEMPPGQGVTHQQQQVQQQQSADEPRSDETTPKNSN